MAQILPWQQQNWALLNQYLIQDKIPQALLIKGAKGLGKKTLALSFAKTLLCINRLETGHSCEQCSRCKLFSAQTHPDFISLSPKEDGQLISIDMIRQLKLTMALKPQFEHYRVILINPANKLNHAAANAFLKCLEEPNERTCILLLTESLSRLPATILSRCQTMSVIAPTLAVAKTWLAEQHVIKNSELLLTLAHGAPLLAQAYAEMNILPLRQQCFNDWIKVVNLQINPIQIAEKWHKQATATLILWLMSWVADMIKYCYQIPIIYLHNPDFQADLQPLAHSINLKKMDQFYDYLQQRQQQLDTPINQQLMFEELLVLGTQLRL
jgi:DNA polymerase-3 subunit delta'